jgi:hypothetical protein
LICSRFWRKIPVFFENWDFFWQESCQHNSSFAYLCYILVQYFYDLFNAICFEFLNKKSPTLGKAGHINSKSQKNSFKMNELY